MPSDRTKRRLVLMPTRILPHTQRIAARRSLLAQLELGRVRRAGIAVIAHPKSGNTWLRSMLGRACQLHYGLPDSIFLKTDELARVDARIPRFCVTSGSYSYEDVIGRAFDAEHCEFAGKKLIFFTRHPCDIATSWYLHYSRREATSKRELMNADLEPPVDLARISRWDFVMHPGIGLPWIIDYLNIWEERFSRLSDVEVVSYEELRTHPVETLTRLTSYMELPFNDEVIRQAVDYCCFDNLRQLELSNHFEGGGLKRRDTSDPDSLKVRRARVGGYREDFSPAQITEMDALVEERLSPTLGY